VSATCPFCGANAVRFDHAPTLAGTLLYWAECKRCRARGPHAASGRDHANAAWSARASTPLEHALNALVAAQEKEFREDLAAERERVRRWKARLRWRAERCGGSPIRMLDRLHFYVHPVSATKRGRLRVTHEIRSRVPIAGPKPGRFLP